ncbi:MAG: hypothetical protein VKP57_03525 [Candidatus Sericytochromatia bacterium]|nr:hypothetical protein [Candidatus Sericytochromatia bacterium]
MSPHFQPRRTRLAALFLAATTSACAVPDLARRVAVDNRDAQVTSPVSGTGEIVAVQGPDGVMMPGARYRVLEGTINGGSAKVTGTVSTASGPLAGALVTFMDDDGRFLVLRDPIAKDRFALLSSRCDTSGQFETPMVFPDKQPVIAQVLFGQQRRLLALAQAGSPVAVDEASTLVVEFFRSTQATRHPDAPFLSAGSKAQPAAAVALADSEAGRLRAAVRDGTFVMPPRTGSEAIADDFTIGRGAELARRYMLGMVTVVADSHKAWSTVLENVPLAIVTDAGNTLLNSEPLTRPATATEAAFAEPINVEASGSSYLLISGKAGLIDRVSGGQRITYLGSQPAGVDFSFWDEPVSSDDSNAGNFFTGSLLVGGDIRVEPALTLRTIIEARQDLAGNVAMTFDESATLGFACKVGGNYFGRPMQAGRFYMLGNPEATFDGSPETPLAETAWGRPFGLAFDDSGNLFVADRGANRVRRIDRVTGLVTTVLGDGWPYTQPVLAAVEGGLAALNYASTTEVETPLLGGGTASVAVPDFGRMKDSSGSVRPGLTASFSRPTKLVWQRRKDGRAEIFVLDLYNQAVRRAEAPPGDDFRDAVVTTLVGKAVDEVRSLDGSASYIVSVGARGRAPERLADLATVGLDLVEIVSAYRWVQAADAGIAIDRTRQRLYVTAPNARQVVMVDLNSQKGRAIATDGGGLFEGPAMGTVLPTKLGGLDVLANGDVIFADTANNTARRLRTGIWIPE